MPENLEEAEASRRDPHLHQTVVAQLLGKKESGSTTGGGNDSVVPREVL